MHLLTLIAVTSIALAASISVVRPHPAPPAASPAQLAPLARRDPSPRFPSRRRRHRPHRHRQPDNDSDDNQDDDGAAARVEAIVLPGFANISTAVDGSSANVSAFGQAFLFSPPAPEDDDVDVIDPYDGLFNVFRAFDLSPEQEQTLVNRSYYFKVGPYVAKQAQVQLMATQSPTANLTVPAVPDIQDPQPLPLDIAPPKPDADRPPESRAAITLGDENNENGAVLVNNTFTNLPKDFVPSEPVPEGLGSVLVPYQVAALRDGQQPVADPQGGGGSYLVMQPRAYGGQSGGGGGEGGQGARMQQDQVRHMAVLSDIDDVLKDTRVFSSTPSREALVNTYAEIYQPIPGMPELIRDTILGANSSTNPALTFHYISGSPLPLAPGLLQFFQAYYPPGSLTLRPVTSFDSDSISNFLSDGFTNEFRLQAHRDVLNTYPQAEAVVFGDTTETTVETYLDVLSEYPERVKCVYLRRLQGSGSSLTADQAVDKINDRVTEELRQRAREVVVVFDDPKELQGLDFAASPVKCR